MTPLLRTALLRFLVFGLWIALSAWLFVLFEHTGRNERREKYQLLRSLYESMASKYNMSIRDFNNLTSAAYEAMSEPGLEWTYHNALDFVIQASTTIGYGYITPKTPKGQVMCICTSLIGIPITMLALKSVGEVIVCWVTAIIQKLEKKLLKRPEPKGLQIKSAVTLFSLMVLLIIVNGFLVVGKMHWTLLEGVYFCFVTLTTIGFGDYTLQPSRRFTHLETNSSVGNESKDESEQSVTFSILFGTLSLCYLILCLCIVSSVLNSFMAALESQRCQPRCAGCIPRKTRKQIDFNQKNVDERGETNIACINMEQYGFQKENTTSLSVIDIKKAETLSW
ncbi:potassium channel subfamily K member 15-like isoform X1 [Montipora capricornis]|uniref:potassium channel subfamily K member 15-like isoform X1 n=1 Tax=Montipora capricornis TaxID=246305 RepID=UPI0035F13E34